MTKGFTLVEVLIVVAILCIMAAIIIPESQSNSQEAKESAAKDNLRILRQQIDLYATRYKGDLPGYPFDIPSSNPVEGAFKIQMVNANGYLSDLPRNPFIDRATLRMVNNGVSCPTEATCEYG